MKTMTLKTTAAFLLLLGLPYRMLADPPLRTPSGSTVAGDGTGITDPSAFLRATKINGKGSLADRPSELWRLTARLQREQASVGGLVFAGRVRTVCLGDSVAVKLQTPITSYFGYGGGDTVLQQWTRTAPTPSDSEGGGNYAVWTAGTYALYDEWARTPGGLVMNLDASFVGGSTISAPASVAELQVSHSVRVHFLAGNNTGSGNLSYGDFRLQYQINKTGSWINAPVSGIVRAPKTPQNYVTSGSHLTGNTSIAVTGGTGTIPSGSTVIIGVTEYTVTTGVTGAGNIIISPGLVSGNSAGTAVLPTAVNTNSGIAERYASATFNFPTLDKYNIRIVATAGRVRLCKVVSDAGAFGGGAVGQGVLTGAAEVGFDQGGKSLASHFVNTPGEVMNDALGLVDPHVVVFKSANAYTLGNYQTYWPTFAARVMAAAPSALFVVCGSHPQSAFPTTADAGFVAVDDYLREWCASTQGAIFMDVRQSFPEYVTDNSADDLWSDGVHIYSQNSGNWGGGDWWVATRVWEALRPAFESVRLGRNPFNWSAVLPFYTNEIRMYDGSGGESARTNRFSFVSKPRVASSVVVRPTSATYNGGTQLFGSETGFGATASDDANSPNSLHLISDGNTVMAFGRHVSLGSGYLGCFIGHSGLVARAKNGCRILAPPQNYGANPALVAEGVSGQAATTRIFGVDRDATSAAAGAPLWSWFPDGSVEYEGTTDDASEVKFVTGNPTADVTITTPASQTGTVCVFLGILADPPAGTIPAGAIYVDNSATGNAAGTWLYSGSAWTQLN